ncbi:MAG: hypothetical protein LBI44_00580 [Oscillospiraceae bacterium]|nr:hypothetical protein [Oscillospiraceae bacterium]
MRECYYTPSGKVTGGFFLMLSLLCAFFVPVLSAAYVYFVYYTPWIYLNIIAAVVCGAALGAVTDRAARLGKARSPAVVALCAVAAVAVMKYVQWCFYIPLVYDESYGLYERYEGYSLSFGQRLSEALRYLPRPGEVYKGALSVNEFGVWGLTPGRADRHAGDNVTGTALLAVWLGEFAFMAAGSALTSRNASGFPFSETANDWYEAVKEKPELDTPLDFSSLKSQMERGDMALAAALAAKGKTDGGDYIRLSFFRPPPTARTEDCYMSATRFVTQAKRRGGGPGVTKPINYMSLSACDMAKFLTGEGGLRYD